MINAGVSRLIAPCGSKVRLPWLLARFAQAIQRVVGYQGQAMLEKRQGAVSLRRQLAAVSRRRQLAGTATDPEVESSEGGGEQELTAKKYEISLDDFYRGSHKPFP